MRLQLQLSQNTIQVPFDYQQELIRHFHRILPENSVHDDLSLYSLSWLTGSKIQPNGFTFPNGAKWFISFYDDALAKEFLVQTLKIPKLPFGMKISDIQIKDTPQFDSFHYFHVASPILAKQFDGTTIKHRIYSDPQANEVLTQTLQTKLRKAGLSEDVTVRFDNENPTAKTKLVTIKNIKNRASMCPVIIEGNPESISFAWNVGIGHCTGSGFGSVY